MANSPRDIIDMVTRDLSREAPAEKRDNLFGLTAMLGMHYFDESLVRAVFAPKFEEIRNIGVIDRWLNEKYQEGFEQVITREARELALSLLMDRFGQVPAELAERIQQADANWCRKLALSVPKANALEDLDLS